MRALAIVLAALIVQGCRVIEPDLVCTAQYVYAVTVEVQDSLTGGPPGSTPTGTLADGGYRETMESYGGQFLQGGGERPGTYDVEVRADGYRPWRVEGVEAGHDGCHVENNQFLAQMVPLSTP
ncbi:MAG: hypothetical protein OXN18_14065 [Gemmatimonadota bacterium]|nr:hypothetical protein [Gemmatimonadota bacterium]